MLFSSSYWNFLQKWSFVTNLCIFNQLSLIQYFYNKKGHVKMKSTGSCCTIIGLKAKYSFEPDNMISLPGSILIKVSILQCCGQPLINGKYLHWATANTHYSNMDSESNH